MKEILINGEKWFYNRIIVEYGEYGGLYACAYTAFYKKPTKTETRYKYWFFGEKSYVEVEKDCEEYDFKVDIDIESEKLTKAEVRASIERAIELMNRRIEIENGQII